MAEKESLETTIIEERVESMVDPTASEAEQNPTKRIALFLKPTLNPNSVPPQLPKIQSFSSSSKPNVRFLCRSNPLKGWQTWVEKLRQTQEPAWRKAGIFDAIKCSTYHIVKVKDLIFSLVERWCPETNTFVFPWGEATVTLEDVFVLGGFSPLGVSVSSSSSSCLGKDVEQVENKLIMSYRKLKENTSNLSHAMWQEHFMGCGDQIEYAALLVLWLTRHVFPNRNHTAVSQAVFVLAARISCGAKLAFGPVVLASIYRDLTLLKKEVLRSVRGHCSGDGQFHVLSPLHLVQVWAWERFPLLGPVPRMIDCGEVRLARWESRVRKLCDNIDVEMCLDSARENFRWRPYGMSIENWSLPRFYVNSGMWVVVDSDEEWKLFAKCLMVGQFWGLDCIEGYNPHRVALQFGFDQDIPKSVDLSKSICTLDELGYRMNLKGLKLYLPPRLHEGDITSRYFDWWRTRSEVQEVALVGFKRKLRTGTRMKKIAKSFDTSNELKAIIVANVGENSMEKSPPRDELWTTSCSMSECSKTDISCTKLAVIELHRGIDQEEGGMELAEMLLEKQQVYDAMNSVCSQFASKHQNLDNEIGQVMDRCPLIQPEGAAGKSEDVAREQSKERNIIKHLEYLEANIPVSETPTEGHGTCKNEPAEALCQNPDTNHGNIPVNSHVAASLPVMDKSDQKSFAASCLEYESRMSRLERVISALSVYKPT